MAAASASDLPSTAMVTVTVTVTTVTVKVTVTTVTVTVTVMGTAIITSAFWVTVFTVSTCAPTRHCSACHHAVGMTVMTIIMSKCEHSVHMYFSSVHIVCITEHNSSLKGSAHEKQGVTRNTTQEMCD